MAAVSFPLALARVAIFASVFALPLGCGSLLGLADDVEGRAPSGGEDAAPSPANDGDGRVDEKVADAARFEAASPCQSCDAGPGDGREDAASCGSACDAAAWETQTSGADASLFGVGGSGWNDIYVVGDNGTVLHSKGDGIWVHQTSGTQHTLASVWASGKNDIYTVGENGTVLHSAGDGVWSVQTAPTTVDLASVWGSGAGDVYAVGGAGTILHSSGNGAWTLLDSGTRADLNFVWGTRRDNVYATGSGTILHSVTLGSWRVEPIASKWPLSIWGESDNNLYALDGTGALLHSAGRGTWDSLLEVGPGAFGDEFPALWGYASGEVYAAYFKNVVRWTGHDWGIEYRATSDLTGAWQGPFGTYVVGKYGVILHHP